nr:hypothetical protein [Pantoea sp. B9002]
MQNFVGRQLIDEAINGLFFVSNNAFSLLAEMIKCAGILQFHQHQTGINLRAELYIGCLANRQWIEKGDVILSRAARQ